jgi:predicted AAA+ superfamily ATPase
MVILHYMISRNITKNIMDALSDTPVVFLAGARQTGKSTLVQHLPEELS